MTNVYYIFHHPEVFTARSAFPQLVELTGAIPLVYELTWVKWQRRSWTAGHLLRRFGNWYYGSGWNALVPWLDERRFLRRIRRGGSIVHFLWGEFASPKRAQPYRRKGARLVGTFHCSARRLDNVLGRKPGFQIYDRIILVSKTQKSFFVSRGYPEAQLRVIPLGVDTDFFRPAQRMTPDGRTPLRAILVGETERDHEFMAAVLNRAPTNLLRLKICTHTAQHHYYNRLPHAELLPRLTDEELLRLYQDADLMIMPMLDCTANDAMLECMACGTPIMVNKVGGIPEYVDPGCNVVMEGKDVAGWAKRIGCLAEGRERLFKDRGRVRAWAERFSWANIVREYGKVYAELTAE